MMIPASYLVVLNFSIAVPAVISIIKIRYLVRTYLPFFIFIWSGMLNDTVSYAFILNHQSNMLNSNVYILFEYFILLAQFAAWSMRPVLYYVYFAAAGLSVWLLDNVYLNEVMDNNSIFRLTYSMIIVLFSMDKFNRVVIYEKAPLGKNSTFLICTGFILFFTCKAFMESFNIFEVGLSALFYKKLFLILSCINLLANLLYAYAIPNFANNLIERKLYTFLLYEPVRILINLDKLMYTEIGEHKSPYP